MPKFMFGFWSRARVILKLPVPIMPTLPEPNCRWNVSPFSARSLSWTLPALIMSRATLQHLLDAVADERLVARRRAHSILAPEAHISGPTVKMLQPAQEPGR